MKGNYLNFPLEENCPVGMAIILFLAKRIGKPEMIFNFINNTKLFSLYNASRLDIKDKTPIKEIFRVKHNSPKVTIIEV